MSIGTERFHQLLKTCSGPRERFQMRYAMVLCVIAQQFEIWSNAAIIKIIEKRTEATED